MRPWMVLYRKEMLEMWRSFKWLWLPVVFIILGASQPISTYYMPQILEAVGGLPPGAVFEMPVPTGGEMMGQVMSQYGTLGVLVLVLAGMGIVAGEKQHRYVSLVMVRPVPAATFISAKWAAFVSLGVSSLIAGALAGWYYTEVLIGSVDASRVLTGVAVYAVWLIFVMTVTVWMSATLKGSSGAAFASILVAVVLSMLTGIADRFMAWSPSRMSSHAMLWMADETMGKQFGLNIACSLILIVLLLALTMWSFSRQELAD